MQHRDKVKLTVSDYRGGRREDGGALAEGGGRDHDGEQELAAAALPADTGLDSHRGPLADLLPAAARLHRECGLRTV